MKALFSRLTVNNDALTPSSSTNSIARDNKAEKRGRAISHNTYSDKYQNGASLYAEPQDILYPSNAARQNGHHEQKATTARPSTVQRHGTATSKASVLPLSTDPALERRGTKTFFESLRGRKPPSTIETTGLANGGMRRQCE